MSYRLHRRLRAGVRAFIQQASLDSSTAQRLAHALITPPPIGRIGTASQIREFIEEVQPAGWKDLEADDLGRILCLQQQFRYAEFPRSMMSEEDWHIAWSFARHSLAEYIRAQHRRRPEHRQPFARRRYEEACHADNKLGSRKEIRNT